MKSRTAFIVALATIPLSAFFPGLYLIFLGAALGLCGLMLLTEEQNDDKNLS